MTTTIQKIRGGARIILSAEVWGIALGEIQRSRKPLPEPLQANLVEEDADAGMYAVEIGGHCYWLPMGTDLFGLSILHSEVFCELHPHYYEYASCRVRPGDIVVDAGASEGFFTRFALERGASVLAIEPWGPMADCLRRTYVDEISRGRVSIAQAALAAEEGEGSLHIDPKQPWGANINSAVTSDDITVAIHCATLDTLVLASPFGRCDFIKMDIEGIERDAIRGAHETLRRDRPCLSIAVYHHPTGYLDIKADLQSLGLNYRVAGKGTQRRSGLYIPKLLHAWRQEQELRP